MNYWRRWRRAWRRKLETMFGGKCQNCGRTRRQVARLEFAHRKGADYRFPSGKDNGRGSVRRLTDVKRHPEDYRLLCVPCHRRYDNGELGLD